MILPTLYHQFNLTPIMKAQLEHIDACFKLISSYSISRWNIDLIKCQCIDIAWALKLNSVGVCQWRMGHRSVLHRGQLGTACSGDKRTISLRICLLQHRICRNTAKRGGLPLYCLTMLSSETNTFENSKLKKYKEKRWKKIDFILLMRVSTILFPSADLRRCTHKHNNLPRTFTNGWILTK